MTGFRKWLASPRSLPCCAYLLVAISSLALHGQAGAATLSDHNSSIGLDLSSPAGMTSWAVDSVNQVNQQWFWFRVGSGGPQFDLSHITTTPTVTTFGTKSLTALYDNPQQYGVQLTYTLNGQANGSGRSGLNQAITLFNHTSSPLDFHFFMYSDFVLRGASQAGNQY